MMPPIPSGEGKRSRGLRLVAAQCTGGRLAVFEVRTECGPLLAVSERQTPIMRDLHVFVPPWFQGDTNTRILRVRRNLDVEGAANEIVDRALFLAKRLDDRSQTG